MVWEVWIFSSTVVHLFEHRILCHGLNRTPLLFICYIQASKRLFSGRWTWFLLRWIGSLRGPVLMVLTQSSCSHLSSKFTMFHYSLWHKLCFTSSPRQFRTGFLSLERSSQPPAVLAWPRRWCCLAPSPRPPFACDIGGLLHPRLPNAVVVCFLL